MHKNNPEGRALDPETLMPTPEGWRRLDDIHVGDTVFDDAGRIAYVTGRADWEDRPCFRVTFGDGTEIIADANHQWPVRWAKRVKDGSILRTTEQLANNRLFTEQNGAFFSVDRAKPLQYSSQGFLVDPYCLGLWLGDGSSHHGEMCAALGDYPEIAEGFETAGYRAVQREALRNGTTVIFTVQGTKEWARDGLRSRLLALGLLGNKHIPAAYLRGSVEQRLALLQGLMDSDGSINITGTCVFANNNYQMASGVMELVRSMGCDARLQTVTPESTARYAWGSNSIVSKKTVYRVNFTPSFPAFRLKRKLARQRSERSRNRHYIRSVEPVGRRRTVCIEVDSQSHLFLAGESMVPTHNSVLRNAVRPHHFIKRLEEMEAILFERLSGLPTIYAPQQLIAAAQSGKDPAATAAYAALQKMVTNIKIGEQMGLVLPSDLYPGVNGPSTQRMYDFQLVTPNSGHIVDPAPMVQRYKLDTLKTVLADFIDLGHQARGTQNLAITKMDMFYKGIEGWLHSIAAVHNRYGLDRIWQLNGLDDDLMPRTEPDMASRIDLQELGNFVFALARSGIDMTDPDIEDYLRNQSGMPELTDEDIDEKNDLRDLQSKLVVSQRPGTIFDPRLEPKPAAAASGGKKKPANSNASNGVRQRTNVAKSASEEAAEAVLGAILRGTLRERKKNARPIPIGRGRLAQPKPLANGHDPAP